MPSSRRQASARVTIKDVAKTAGVSTSTVSNVLNGRLGAMTEATLLRVREAMSLLDYRPNSAARGLVTKRTATIGVIVAEIETPLFLQALNVIEPLARQSGYNVILSNARNADDERQALNVLIEKRVDGIIFLSISEFTDDAHLSVLERLGVPAVLVNRSARHDGFDQINWDDAVGIRVAVDHLVTLGHRRIAHLRGPHNRRSGADRVKGYQMGLAEHTIAWREDYVQLADFTNDLPASWQAATTTLLELPEPPTAIIACTDTVAAVAIRTVQKAGWRVPENLAVIGVDDQPFAVYLNPTLSTVRLPVLEAAQRAIELLLERIANPGGPRQHIILPCLLIQRESCGHHLAARNGVQPHA